MQSVTQDFKDVWEALPQRFFRFRVELKRRFFNGSAFVLESSPVVFDEDQIESISPIQWKLDTQRQNKILASNVTLRLKNNDWRWIEQNGTDGLFKADAIATQGYDPYRSQFQIFYGYELPDGTVESIALFTGEAVDYIFDTDKAVTEIQLTGREIKLQTADCQRVATFFTDSATSPATGDGVETEFLAELSTWLVDKVRVATVEQPQGDLGFTLEDINDAEVKTKIVFGTPPGASDAVDWSGRQWQRDKKVGVLVGLICDEAGISAGDRDILEPTYPGISSFKDIDTQAEWELGTLLQNISTLASLGNIQKRWFLFDDFSDGDFTNNPTWQKHIFTSGGSIAVSANKLQLVVQDGNHQIRTIVDADRLVGTWEFTYTAGLSGTGSGAFTYILPWAGSGFSHEGYGLEINQETGRIDFGRIDSGGGAFAENFVTRGNVGSHFGADTKTYRITRDSNGQWKIYQDGTLKLTVTDTTHTVFTFFRISLFTNFGSSLVDKFDDFFFSPEVIAPPTAFDSSTAVYESEVFDLLAAPTEWGPLDFTQTLNGGTVLYETAVADNAGGPFDAFVAIGALNVIQSAFKQFIKVRATITPATEFGLIGPVISRIVINFFSAELFVKHADFKDKDCFAAIQRLAEISNSEFGFTGAGRFFFRPKSVIASSILSIDQSNAIQKMQAFRAGYDRVINSGQVTYDPYYSEEDSITQGEASPTSIERFGKKIGRLSVSDFLFSNNANFSEAMAQQIFESGFKPKRRWRMRTRIIPHLELSDVIDVSFFDSELIEKNIFGDPFQTGFPAFGDNENTIARAILSKVTGISFDIMKSVSTIDCEEVLT